MLQPFTRALNFRIIAISLEFSKNETATVSRPYSEVDEVLVLESLKGTSDKTYI